MKLLAFRSIVHVCGGFRPPLLSVIMAALVASHAHAGQTLQPCAVWVVRNALSSPASWESALEGVRRSGCDRIYLQVSGRWDAYAPSTVFVLPEIAPTDPNLLDRAVREAKAMGIEVHAWINAMLAWSAPDPPTAADHVYNEHPDWFVVDGTGGSMRALSREQLDRRGLVGEGWFLDPARVEVRTELRRFVLEIARTYPIDGIHLDYIRYPAGWVPTEGSERITRLVEMIRQDLLVVRSSAKLSAAVLPVPEEARRSFGQAWDEWLSRDLIDEAVPMVYRRRVSEVVGLVRDYAAPIPRSRVRVGLRVDRVDPREVEAIWRELAADGFAGTALFSHNLLNESDAWANPRLRLR